MNYTDFTRILHQQIALMPKKSQLELAIKICKDLFFDYQKFSETYNWGNPDFLLDGINICESAVNNKVDLSKAEQLRSKIDTVIPDTNDFGSELGSYALNASAAVYETLEFLTDNDTTHIINIATYYTDTIDFKVQENNEMSPEEIDYHPMMVNARQFLLAATR